MLTSNVAKVTSVICSYLVPSPTLEIAGKL